MPTDHEEQTLIRGLERWREQRLTEIERDMNDLTEDHHAAAAGLGIAHRNPGEVAKDITQYLWENLNRSAIELERLERDHQRLRTMEIPQLIVAINQDTDPPQTDPDPTENTPPKNPPQQVRQIITAWKQLVDLQLNPQDVEKHIQQIAAWQPTRTKMRKNEDEN